MAYDTQYCWVFGRSALSGIPPFLFFFSFLNYRMMDSVQKPSTPDFELCHFLLLHSMHEGKDFN
jgi:hypothetical protein